MNYNIFDRIAPAMPNPSKGVNRLNLLQNLPHKACQKR